MIPYLRSLLLTLGGVALSLLPRNKALRSKKSEHTVTETSLGPGVASRQPLACAKKGKVLAVLVAPQMQQVAVLDVAPYRQRALAHLPAQSQCPSALLSDSVQSAYRRDAGVPPIEGIQTAAIS
jgi:hypothetical protein